MFAGVFQARGGFFVAPVSSDGHSLDRIGSIALAGSVSLFQVWTQGRRVEFRPATPTPVEHELLHRDYRNALTSGLRRRLLRKRLARGGQAEEPKAAVHP